MITIAEPKAERSVLDRQHEERKLREWLRYSKYIELYTKQDSYIIPPLYEHLWWAVDKYKQTLPTLRDYQANAVEHVLHSETWSWLIVSWVGTWKSFMIAEIASYASTQKEYACVVVPKQTIALGIKEKFDELGIPCKIVTWKDCVKKAKCHYIMCAQTLNMVFDYCMQNFRYLVLDEIHRMPKQRIDQINIWSWYGGNVIWFTWTPERKDMFEKDFFKFWWCVYNTEQTALPVDVFVYKYEYAYSPQEWLVAGRWLSPDSPEIVNRLLMNNEDRYKHLLLIAKQLMKSHNKIIIFCNRVEHIDKCAEKLSSISPHVITIKGDTNKKKMQIELQSLEKCIIVANVSSAWEWFDHPEISAWVLFYPTQWTVSLQQAVWRIQRPYKDKTKAIFIDVADTYSIAWSKKKVAWYYWRKKIYDSMWWNVTVLSQQQI